MKGRRWRRLALDGHLKKMMHWDKHLNVWQRMSSNVLLLLDVSKQNRHDIGGSKMEMEKDDEDRGRKQEPSLFITITEAQNTLPMVFKTWVFGWGIASCRLICSELWFLLFVGNFSDILDQSLLDKFDGKTLWRISPRRRILGCYARGRSAYVYMFLHFHKKRVDDMRAWKFLFLYS